MCKKILLKMNLKLLVDSKQFWSSLQNDIAHSQKRIYIQTLSFEGDCVGEMLSAEMLLSNSKDKRIIVDFYTRYVLNDRFLYTLKNIFDSELQAEKTRTLNMIRQLNQQSVQVKFTNPVGPILNKFPARNHKKMILVDDHISYVGGINFSEHNFDWHDLMIRFEDKEINDFLRKDFLSTWEGNHVYSEKAFDQFYFYLFDGLSNESSFSVVFDLIDKAQKSVCIQSPYISFPFYERLRSAINRCVKVTLITPTKNNRTAIGYYTVYEALRSGIDLRLYYPGMTHVKYMLIDDITLIFGSTNFDYVSYKIEQELITVITDLEFINNFKEQVIDVDLQKTTAFDGKLDRRKGLFYYMGLKALGAICTSIAKI
jgi:cardiolipin synthase